MRNKESSKSNKTNGIDQKLDLLHHQHTILEIQDHPTDTVCRFVYFESQMYVESKVHFQKHADQSPFKSCCLLNPELDLKVQRTLLSLVHLILYCTTLDEANQRAS